MKKLLLSLFIPLFYSLLLHGQNPSDKLSKALERSPGWNSMGVPIGVDASVMAVTSDQSGNLYIGGSFMMAGGILVSRIAKWDGNNWTPLGTGMNGSVSCIAVDQNGILYAGGSFSTSGGITTNRIAKWDGTNWTALGTGTTTGIISSLAIDKYDNVIAGGTFTSIGGISANRIAKWNGASWSALGSGSSIQVSSIAVDTNNNIYSNSALPGNIAMWDGTGWSSLGSGTDGVVNSLLVDDNNDLYVAGNFTTAGGLPTNGIAKWNGNTSTWFALGTSPSTYVKAMGFDSYHYLYIVESMSPFRLSMWDGASWSVISPATSGGGELAMIGNDLYLGGGLNTFGGTIYNGISHWNGSQWLAFGNGATDRINTIIEAPNGDLYVGGSFTSIGGIPANRVAKWDGLNWSALGSGVDATVFALEIDRNGLIYAGGSISTAGGIPVNYIARWNGISWDSLGTGVTGPVISLKTDTLNNLYVGGQFTSAGGIPVWNIAKWDGSNWSAMDMGIGWWSSGLVEELEIDSAQNVIAAGAFDMIGSALTPCNSLAKWNGSNWTCIGGGITDGYLRCMTIDQLGNIIVGGEIDTVGSGIPAYNFAIWNGSTWSAPGPLYNISSCEVYAVEADSAGNVYIGGSWITTTSGINSVVKWDGVSLTDIGLVNYAGSSVTSVYSLHVKQNCGLYAGGGFYAIDGVPSSCLARYDFSSTPNVSIDLSYADTLCNNSSIFSLSGGTPAGGTYSGPGVIGTTFDPSVAGDGHHTITYSFNDPGGCSSYATDLIYVAYCTSVPQLSKETNELLIFPNPATTEITISLGPENISDYDISVYNMLGAKQKAECTNSHVSVSELSPGMYFILAASKNKGNQVSAKFIKH